MTLFLCVCVCVIYMRRINLLLCWSIPTHPGLIQVTCISYLCWWPLKGEDKKNSVGGCRCGLWYFVLVKKVTEEKKEKTKHTLSTPTLVLLQRCHSFKDCHLQKCSASQCVATLHINISEYGAENKKEMSKSNCQRRNFSIIQKYLGLCFGIRKLEDLLHKSCCKTCELWKQSWHYFEDFMGLEIFLDVLCCPHMFTTWNCVFDEAFRPTHSSGLRGLYSWKKTTKKNTTLHWKTSMWWA